MSDIYFLKFNFMLLEKAYTSFKVSCPDHYTVAVGMQCVCLIKEYEIFIIFLKEPNMFGAHSTHYLGSYECWHKDIELWNQPFVRTMVKTKTLKITLENGFQ